MQKTVEICYDGPYYEYFEDISMPATSGHPPFGMTSTEINVREKFPYMKILSIAEKFPPIVKASVPKDKVEYVIAELKNHGYNVRTPKIKYLNFFYFS